MTESVSVLVRYFAAARAATGIDEEKLVLPGPLTVGGVLAVAVDLHGPDLAQVLERCSYLLDEIAVHSTSSTVLDGQAIDVLPPFAGG